MASTKTVIVTVRPEFDEFIQAMRQTAEMFNGVADQMAALNNHTEAEEEPCGYGCNTISAGCPVHDTKESNDD